MTHPSRTSTNTGHGDDGDQEPGGTPRRPRGTPAHAPGAAGRTGKTRVLTHPGLGGGTISTSLADTWRADLGAGLVVFFVALPLCLGVALASGAPLFSGIVTGIVGGLLVSRLSGSQLMVSGPAAGLTAIVLAAITQLGFQAFLTAVVIAGLLQLVLAVVRAGTIAYFFPSSVIKGMLAAIGLTILIKQLPYLFGAGIGPGASSEPADAHTYGMFGDVLTAAQATRPLALAIGLVSLALLAFGDHPALARFKKIAPIPLVLVLLGVAANLVAAVVAPGVALPAQSLVSLPVVEGLAGMAGLVVFPDFSRALEPAVLTTAVTLAIVASVETLLSLEATDKLDPYKRSSPANRELLAQGAGNTVAGLLGGLPMTGVIVRSSANVMAGAKTWRSAWIHGAFLLVAVLAIPRLLNLIPLATLAAILVFTGFKLAHPKMIADVVGRGFKYWGPFAVTVVAILATDLLVGIAIGFVSASIFVLVDSYRTSHSFFRDEHQNGDHRIQLRLAQEITFLNKAPINKALHELPEGAVVTVDGTRVRHWDPDVIELLHDFRDTARGKGISYTLVAIPALEHSAGAH